MWESSLQRGVADALPNLGIAAAGERSGGFHSKTANASSHPAGTTIVHILPSFCSTATNALQNFLQIVWNSIFLIVPISRIAQLRWLTFTMRGNASAVICHKGSLQTAFSLSSQFTSLKRRRVFSAFWVYPLSFSFFWAQWESAVAHKDCTFLCISQLVYDGHWHAVDADCL